MKGCRPGIRPPSLDPIELEVTSLKGHILEFFTPSQNPLANSPVLPPKHLVALSTSLYLHCLFHLSPSGCLTGLSASSPIPFLHYPPKRIQCDAQHTSVVPLALSIEAKILGTSLVAVFNIRIHLSMQGTRDRSLIWELRSHTPWGN